MVLSVHHQDVTNSSDLVLGLHLSLEELYTQNLLQRQHAGSPPTDLNPAAAPGFPISDYTTPNAAEQKYECANPGAWTPSQLPGGLSTTELAPVQPAAAQKVPS